MFARKTVLRVWSPIPGTRTSSKLFIISTVLLAATVTVLTQSNTPPVSTVQLCVKDNGQLRLTNPGTSCDTSERRTEWVVGGQVTDIEFGRGLVGTRDNGRVTLALDPTIFQGCVGCGKIVAGFNDGPLELPRFIVGEDIPPIAKLNLPAGAYSIFAKVVVAAKQGEEIEATIKEEAQCKLSAGNDFDNSHALLEVEDDRPIQASFNDEVVLTMGVVHRFADAGEATLTCSKGLLTGVSPMEVRNLKIIAIEGASISNVFLGGD